MWCSKTTRLSNVWLLQWDGYSVQGICFCFVTHRWLRTSEAGSFERHRKIEHTQFFSTPRSGSTRSTWSEFHSLLDFERAYQWSDLDPFRRNPFLAICSWYSYVSPPVLLGRTITLEESIHLSPKFELFLFLPLL